MSGPGRKPTISDEELLREIRLLPDPVITATELVDSVKMTRQGVNNRLTELVESGHLRSKQVGSRAVVYWLTETGRKVAADN